MSLQLKNWLILTTIATLIIATSIITPFSTTSLEQAIEDLPPSVVATTTQTSSIDLIKARIKHYAGLYDVSEWLTNYIVKNESGYKPTAVNFNPPVEISCGLVQINTIAHPITCEQAKDPEFALDFLTRNLAKGRCKMWSTCPIANK